MEEAAADDQGLRWLLDVQDAGAGGHPLRVTVGDHSPATVRVAVLERAVDDVRDRLKAPVRVPGRSLGLARRVLDFAHLIEVDERVELAEIHAGERSAHREPVTLEPARRGRHATDGSLTGVDGSGAGMRGRMVMSSTVMAGMERIIPRWLQMQLPGWRCPSRTALDR